MHPFWEAILGKHPACHDAPQMQIDLLLLLSPRIAQSLSATATERAGVMPELCSPLHVFHCQLAIRVLLVTRVRAKGCVFHASWCCIAFWSLYRLHVMCTNDITCTAPLLLVHQLDLQLHICSLSGHPSRERHRLLGFDLPVVSC